MQSQKRDARHVPCPVQNAIEQRRDPNVYTLSIPENIPDLKAIDAQFQTLRYGWKANIQKAFDQGHWNSQILHSSHFFPYDQTSLPFLYAHPSVARVWKAIQTLIPGRGLLISYVNGYTYGTDGYVHNDVDARLGSVHDVTALVYLNDNWNVDWGGETVVFDEHGDDIQQSYLPKLGRVVIFPSNRTHAARPLSRLCTKLRKIIVFKTMHREYNSVEIDFLLHRTLHTKHHDGVAFFEHLYKTMRLLENAGKPRYVCAAGLYHAVYGTSYFRFSNADFTRERVRALIGPKAEALVYEFGRLENRTHALITNQKRFQKEMHKDLVDIEIANLEEQNVRGRHARALTLLRNVFGRAVPHVSKNL